MKLCPFDLSQFAAMWPQKRNNKKVNKFDADDDVIDGISTILSGSTVEILASSIVPKALA